MSCSEVFNHDGPLVAITQVRQRSIAPAPILSTSGLREHLGPLGFKSYLWASPLDPPIRQLYSNVHRGGHRRVLGKEGILSAIAEKKEKRKPQTRT